MVPPGNDTARPREVFARPLRTCCITAVISLLLWCGFDWWQAGPEGQFFVAAIPLLAWYVLAVLSIAKVLQRHASSRPNFTQVLAWVLCGVPALVLLFCAGAAFFGTDNATFDRAWFAAALCVAAICAFAYLARGLRILTGARQIIAAGLGVLTLAGCIWLTDALNVIPDLWSTPETDAAAAAAAPLASTDGALADEESILFSQAPRIDARLAALRSDRPEAARSFFLGFAGVGDEKVFAQEIDLASRVIGKRYAAEGRTLSLINDERDLDSAPLASLAGLRYALRGMASRMNVERDVLFLAISSHGSDDPAIIVANSGLPLNDLTAGALADALHDAGVKWRVIIISACYAGGFIDSLKDSRTIVIAAAAADRTSFGCGVDSDLTYFGEAFYRDALPNTGTLREAFTAAKAAIAARERRERVDASRPQAYFGTALEAKLDAMAPRLTASAAPW